MNLEDFIKGMQDYYGLYPKGQRTYIVVYLQALTDEERAELFNQTLLTFSSQYGKTPDLSVFDALLPKVKAAIRRKQIAAEEKRLSVAETNRRRLESPSEAVVDIAINILDGLRNKLKFKPGREIRQLRNGIIAGPGGRNAV